MLTIVPFPRSSRRFIYLDDRIGKESMDRSARWHNKYTHLHTHIYDDIEERFTRTHLNSARSLRILSVSYISYVLNMPLFFSLSCCIDKSFGSSARASRSPSPVLFLLCATKEWRKSERLSNLRSRHVLSFLELVRERLIDRFEIAYRSTYQEVSFIVFSFLFFSVLRREQENKEAENKMKQNEKR